MIATLFQFIAQAVIVLSFVALAKTMFSDVTKEE